MLKALFIIGAYLAFSFAAYAEEVTVNEAQESAWGKEFANQYKSSKNYGELILKSGSFTAVDLQMLKQVTDLSKPLPKMTFANGTFTFDNKLSVKVVSLRHRNFSINGRNFVYDSKKSLAYNIGKIDELLKQKKTSMYDFFIQPAYAEKLNSDLYSFWESLSPGHASMVSAGIQVGMKSTGLMGSMASLAVIPVHGMVTKTEALFAPSCKNQVSDLKGILEQNNIALAGIDCDGVMRDFDSTGTTSKTVSFWTAEGTKKEFNADWVNGIVWDDPNRIYIFNSEELTEYREINKSYTPADKNSKKVLSYEKGTNQYETARQKVEAYRRVFKYLGDNRSCYKCQDEIRSGLVTAAAPAPRGQKGQGAETGQGTR